MYLKGRERQDGELQRQADWHQWRHAIQWFNPQMHKSLASARQIPVDRNSIHTSRAGGRNPTTQAITYHLQVPITKSASTAEPGLEPRPFWVGEADVPHVSFMAVPHVHPDIYVYTHL